MHILKRNPECNKSQGGAAGGEQLPEPAELRAELGQGAAHPGGAQGGGGRGQRGQGEGGQDRQ